MSEDAAWSLLQARLDEQRGQDQRLMAQWHQRQEHLQLASVDEGDKGNTCVNAGPRGSDEHEENPVGAEAVTSPPPPVASKPAHRRLDLSVQIPDTETAAGVSRGPWPSHVPSSEIASNRLLSPDLARFTGGANVEWLNGSVGTSLDLLEDGIPFSTATPTGKAACGVGGRAVRVHAYAGNGNNVSSNQVLGEGGAVNAVRYSLFDLAAMDAHHLCETLNNPKP